METSVRKLLEREIEAQLETLDKLEFGSEVYKITVDGLAKLLDKLNDMDRMDHEFQDKLETRETESELKIKQIEAESDVKFKQIEVETELKLKQLNEEKKDHIIKNSLTAVSFLGGIILTVWGTKKSIEFEKTGTITTIAGRAFINKLFPKK